MLMPAVARITPRVSCSSAARVVLGIVGEASKSMLYMYEYMTLYIKRVASIGAVSPIWSASVLA